MRLKFILKEVKVKQAVISYHILYKISLAKQIFKLILMHNQFLTLK